MYKGYLKVRLITADGAVPLPGEKVYIKTSDAPYNVDETNYDYLLTTDISGSAPPLGIDAPDPEISLNEFDEEIPYSLADVYVSIPGYFPVRITGNQIYAGQLSTLPILMTPLANGFSGTTGGVIVYNIPPNTLLTGEEREQVSYPDGEASTFVAKEVAIPEYVRVHLGTPSSNAETIYVPFPEYIKNVASSEIYPTWQEETLRANIMAIISLTLNRIYTEWYPSQGYDFDITNSTRYDQSFVPGRNIFDSVSRITDELFNTYIVRTGFINPLFASYCDGKTVSCDGLSQWGSENLGKQGLPALSILKNYYGNNIELVTTDNISNFTASYPGTPLSLGSEGRDVEEIRRQLYRISFNYPLIPRINPALRTFDSSLDTAVRTFQEIFGLTVDGIVGKATWYRISYIYSSIVKLAELGAEGETGTLPVSPPTVTVTRGDRSRDVARLQFILGYISLFYTGITTPALDGIFGEGTERAVRDFQLLFGLPVTGTVNASDWVKLYEVYQSVLEAVTPSLAEQGYPGTPLRRGSRGDAVLLMQSYLNTISDSYPVIPQIEADGVFGSATENAVRAFQRRFFIRPTGIIDAVTWGQIVEVYNFIQRENF